MYTRVEALIFLISVSIFHIGREKKNQYYRDEIYPRAIILVDMIKIVPARICLNHHISIRHRYVQVQIPSGGKT